METGKAIYKLLKDSSAVGAICADRIYPELAQQDVDTPFIVYTVTDTTPSPTKNATSKLDTARVELFCISDDYEQAMNLGIAVRTALDRVSGDVSGVQVQSIDFDTSDIQYDPDQRVYVLEQTYDVRVQLTGTAVALTGIPSNAITVEEADGDPSGNRINRLVFSNGTVVIDGNTARVTTGATTLTVKELDGTPSDTASTLVFPNGTLSFDGDVATLDLSIENLDPTGILEQIATELAGFTDLTGSDFPNGIIGDFNQDGFVGSADLLILLSYWGDGFDATEYNNRKTASFDMATAGALDMVRSVNSETADRDGDVNLSTSEIPEGTNLYYTDARVDLRIGAALISDLSDTPNGIGTAGQVLAVNSTRTGYEFVTHVLPSDLSSYVQTVNALEPGVDGNVELTTEEINEGEVNFYFTNARFDTRYATKTHYHNRYSSEAETKRSGATATLEVYYTARPDGDGYAESEVSDVGETDTINRTLYYSTKYLADPDTAGDWTQYTTQPADNASFATAKAALLAGLNETDATAETRGTLPLSLKMVRTTSAAATDLLLDTYTGAAAAYSVRKLDKDYTGSCMRVREASGDTETDIGFDGSGNLDTSAIATHCGSANGYVVTWYDQSGNSNNATQSTASLQPQIYNGTAVITENGKPAIDWAGNKQLPTPLSGTGGSPAFTSFHVATIHSGGPAILMATTSTSFYASGVNGDSGNPTSTQYRPATYYGNGSLISSATRADIYNNHSSQGLLTVQYTGNGNTYQLGYISSGFANFNCQECIIYHSDQTSSPTNNRTGIESDINTYFSIYT